MNADDLTTLTTDALDRRSTAREQGPSENLTALKTRTRFHRDGFHNVSLVLDQRREPTRVARVMEAV